MANEIVKYIRKDGSLNETWKNGETLLNAQNLNSVATNLQSLLNWYNTLTWQKSITKPTYNSSEIGAEIAGTANMKIDIHNRASNAHEGILAPIVHTHKLSQITDFPVYGNKGTYVVMHREDDISWSAGRISEVAITGNYNSLIDAPLVPTRISSLENDAGYISSRDLQKTYTGKYIGGTMGRNDNYTVFYVGFKPSYVRISYVRQKKEQIYILDSRFLYRTDDEGHQFEVGGIGYKMLDYGFALTDLLPSGMYNELDNPGTTYTYVAIGKGVAELPYVTTSDTGKSMIVNEKGDWELLANNDVLPVMTNDDVGGFLRCCTDDVGALIARWQKLQIANNQSFGIVGE